VDLEANVDEFMHREINYMPWPHHCFFSLYFKGPGKISGWILHVGIK
jgi:hypothetical protein